MTIQLNRRLFLAGTGTALVVGLSACKPRHAARTGAAMDDALNLWVAVAPDGIVTIRMNATDIGQGAQTGIAQIVADEMDADFSKVRVEMAPVTDAYLIKGDDKGYYTGGSSSIAEQYELFARAGAAARAMLVAAAQAEWQDTDAPCSVSNGVVTNLATREALSFGALTARAASMPLPAHPRLKAPGERRLVGRDVPRLDIPNKVRGRTIYGIDVKIDGMLVGTIAQCPWFGGSLKSVDAAPALAIRGVERVVRLSNAVAVVARNFWTARKGLEALSPQWTKPADAVASDDAMRQALQAEIGAPDSYVGTPDSRTKSATIERVAQALATSRRVFRAQYEVQLLAHAAMEPMNATARVTPDGCELWAPMQSQGDMRKDVAQTLSLPPAAVTLHSMTCGGGFGRRLKTDYGVLAALVAREVGRPVKLIWTREEDFSHDFYRPASAARLTASLRDDWTIAALDYRGATSNDTAVGGFLHNYAIAAAAVRQKRTALQFPIGAWRSVDPSITIFLLESFIDEIAHTAKIDPLQYRRMLLAKETRHLRVLNAAARMADWGKPRAGRAQGLAFFSSHSWGTAVAQVVELSVDSKNKITLHRVCCAIDPGLAVNPNQVRAQAEGGIILGLSAALGERITLKDGRVEQTNFDTYAVPRLASIPEIAVAVLQSDGVPPGGCGEPPVPPIMPALANAVFAATGKRIRRLPLSTSGFAV